MLTYPYQKLNAFAAHGSAGNPAAYLRLGADTLTDEQMLKIAGEHKGFVSEMVFVSRSKKADMKLTYYSSECEVDFCGHGTIATMYSLLKSDEELSHKSEVVIETNRKGLLTVYNRIRDEKAVYVKAPKPEKLKCPCEKAEAARALSLPESALDSRYPIGFIDAGLRTLIVPITELQDETTISPDIFELKEFCEADGIDIVLAFSMQTKSDKRIAHTRVFAPRFGYLEDPATGSGNSAFGAYMLENGIWAGEATAIEQGAGEPYNKVCLSVENGELLFGGGAQLIIDGSYFIR
ncbi:MAG: PhzF family phenazine biosynthesis protein [Eubacteriales bacterium]|nr:PhzF family phenazine biosynthesis protein [Eubacteriales bacterium]MDD3881119.1 PhzF family phenazine biosynthesis protein [Eubacteriales bacterium]MDD4511501.1 PhzF family phenazine biosynthesis protein [Eubacteriales bacterium]